jgi:hypothetical protein
MLNVAVRGGEDFGAASSSVSSAPRATPTYTPSKIPIHPLLPPTEGGMSCPSPANTSLPLDDAPPGGEGLGTGEKLGPYGEV